VLFRRIEDAKQANPSLKIIVADPRRTDTAGMADLYLPLLPGTDVMLFHGLLHIMLWEGWTDAAYIACPHQRLRRTQGDRCATARRNAWRRPAASPRTTC
jgi:anaerobic selenocysteine-containing dehydrogenase